MIDGLVVCEGVGTIRLEAVVAVAGAATVAALVLVLLVLARVRPPSTSTDGVTPPPA